MPIYKGETYCANCGRLLVGVNRVKTTLERRRQTGTRSRGLDFITKRCQEWFCELCVTEADIWWPNRGKKIILEGTGRTIISDGKLGRATRKIALAGRGKCRTPGPAESPLTNL